MPRTSRCCAPSARTARPWWRWAPAPSTAAWAQRNRLPLRPLLEAVYPQGVPDDPELPLLLNHVHPIHEVVHIDYSLPGCPPSADAFWQFLTDLMSGRTPQLGHGLIHYD